MGPGGRSVPRLAPEYYRDDDVVALARDLLGKVLCTCIEGTLTSATITETEAYRGPGDRASHAWNNRRTRRTEPIFAAGGLAYVYLCYGIHHLFNVVTGPAETPHAVLVRAGQPLQGKEVIRSRRGEGVPERRLLSGPGSLGKGLGITTDLTGADLQGGTVWIEERGVSIPDTAVDIGPRVGIDYAGEDAALPWRFIARL